MSWLSSLFGPPSRDQFAKTVMARLRRGGVTEKLTYDRDEFSIKHDNRGVLFLNNSYAEFSRANKQQRVAMLDRMVIMWSTTQHDLPDDFEDVRADLMPMVRSRAYFEFGLHRAGAPADSPAIPYEVIGESLAAALAYDLPTSIATINDQQLSKWGVTFYEAMEAAKQNLRETTKSYAQIGSLFAMSHGDAYDATRILLSDWFRELPLAGAPIVMVPNRDTLLVAGADDDALATMVAIGQEEIRHERSISGVAFRLVNDVWEPWMPSADHALFNSFNELRLQSWGQDYAEQKHVLKASHSKTGEDVYVAEFTGLRQENSGRVESYCVWTRGVRTLLPRADLVMLASPTAEGDVTEAARGRWEDVERIAGHLMQPQDTYPPRWLVEDFPTEAELREIGLGD